MPLHTSSLAFVGILQGLPGFSIPSEIHKEAGGAKTNAWSKVLADWMRVADPEADDARPAGLGALRPESGRPYAGRPFGATREPAEPRAVARSVVDTLRGQVPMVDKGPQVHALLATIAGSASGTVAATTNLAAKAATGEAEIDGHSSVEFKKLSATLSVHGTVGDTVSADRHQDTTPREADYDWARFDLATGSGKDRLDIAIEAKGSGHVGAEIDTGGGDDDVTLEGRESRAGIGDDISVYAHLCAGTGNDRLTVRGQGNFGVDAGDGDDMASVSQVHSCRVSGGSGDDTVIAKDVENFFLDGGYGNDAITVDACESGAISAGDGDDVIRVSSGRGWTMISGGAGKDQITVEGHSSFTLWGRGDGNDVVDYRSVDRSQEHTIRFESLNRNDLTIDATEDGVRVTIKETGETLTIRGLSLALVERMAPPPPPPPVPSNPLVRKAPAATAVSVSAASVQSSSGAAASAAAGASVAGPGQVASSSAAVVDAKGGATAVAAASAVAATERVLINSVLAAKAVDVSA
ncbi:MAG: hypothetical protein ACM33T_13840 [Solirubrobacterales bacterium]